MERVNNFKEMVEKYYNSIGQMILFTFIHVQVKYTYIDLHHQYIDGNDNWTKKEKRERINATDTIFVPIVTSHEYYLKELTGKPYNLPMTLYIKENIDIGDTDNIDMSKLEEKITSIIPKECSIVSELQLGKIAEQNGYDAFKFRIYDAEEGKPAVFYSSPYWVYEVYGVSKKENEYQNKGKKI